MFARLFKRPDVRTISDKEWFELQFNPSAAKAKYGIFIPEMPSDKAQIGFTALVGRQNMKQAFNFYDYTLKATGVAAKKDPVIMDFGGGWGRVARLFLRETKPSNIYIAETREYVINLLDELKSPYSIIHNKPEPPLDNLPKLDLVVAYSVFSHLSEKYFLDWTNYFLSMLKPGGHIVFTSRGRPFIRHLQHLHDGAKASDPGLAEHVRRLKELMPPPSDISERFEAGEFQFYPIGGSAELTPSFFGEAFIPEQYLRKMYPKEFISYVEDVKHVDQSIIVLRKT